MIFISVWQILTPSRGVNHHIFGVVSTTLDAITSVTTDKQTGVVEQRCRRCCSVKHSFHIQQEVYQKAPPNKICLKANKLSGENVVCGVFCLVNSLMWFPVCEPGFYRIANMYPSQVVRHSMRLGSSCLPNQKYSQTEYYYRPMLIFLFWTSS